MINVRPIDLRPAPPPGIARTRTPGRMPAVPADSLWARMVERWHLPPETQDDYDARQW